jgi:hypothetical protein
MVSRHLLEAVAEGGVVNNGIDLAAGSSGEKWWSGRGL